MGKVTIGFYCYFNSDILTKVLQKCSLSSPLPTVSCLFNPLNLIAMATMRLNLHTQKIKNNLLRSHKGDEAEGLQNCS